MRHHATILFVAGLKKERKEKFIPAHIVKKLKMFPNDYRKRLSEMKRKGWVKRVGSYERFGVWEITRLGEKVALKESERLINK